MPACSRETVGWLSTSSQLGSRPILSPSETSATGSTFKASRVTTNLLSRVCMSSTDCEEDDLHDVYEHEREHERRGDDVRREPELQELVQVYERVYAPEHDGRLDGFEQQSARVRVERARLRLVLLARGGEQLGQLLALQV